MKDVWTWEQIKAWHDERDGERAEEAKRNLKRRVMEIDTHVQKALKLDHLSENDRGALNYARACYEPLSSLSACLSMRQTNATMCNPASVLP